MKETRLAPWTEISHPLLRSARSRVRCHTRFWPVPPQPHAKQIHLKHVLVIGQTKGFEHDSVSAAMAAIYDMGKESGLWDTECGPTPNC